MNERDKRFLEEELKRGRAVTGELASKLAELGDEDISAAIDGLISASGSYPMATAQERLAYDRQADAELKEMFNNIVLQFLEPVGSSIHILANCVARVGDPPEKAEMIRGNVDACIGALKPLINASDTIKYHDIYDVLKAIERPLLDVQQGKRKTLTDRDTKNLTRDFNELSRLIHQSLGQEHQPLLPQQVSNAKERFRTASNYLLSEMLPFYKEIAPTDLQKLHAAGINRLNDLIMASAKEISEASSISVETAEQVKLCTLRALMNASVNAAGSSSPPPTTTTTVQLQPKPPTAAPEIPELDGPPTLTEFSTEEVGAALHGSLPMFFPETTPPVGERERLLDTLDVMLHEVASYSQSATNLNIELERTHRAILRLRVERERMRGELEFHRDELKQFFEHRHPHETESQEALAVHKSLAQSLRQVTDIILVAMKKVDIIYSQMEDSVRDIRDLENEVADLRRKRRGSRTPRGRHGNPDQEGN